MTAKKPADRGAVVQFEFDRARVKSMSRETTTGINTTKRPYFLALEIIRGALQDTFENGGTLVVVVGEEKVTVVQRPDVEELGEVAT